MTRKSARIGALSALVLPLLAGCESRPQAWGEANAIIVVAHDTLWQQVQDSVMAALEPTIQTVRDERTFNVTWVSPFDSSFVTLRKFKQLLSIGAPSDPWVEPLVESGRNVPYVTDETNVWANDQLVTGIVVEPTSPVPSVLATLPEVSARIDSLYRVWAVRRMFLSEPDTARRSRLGREAGFTILLPSVYREEQVDSTWIFENWTEVRGNEIRRTITVSSRPGVDTTTVTENALAWRSQVVAIYVEPQQAEPDQLVRRLVRSGSTQAFEVQGVWTTDFGGVPAAGPFITRVVPCPAQNRTYLVDAWLYAPARGSKYEYMVQLQTILNTFRCGTDVAPSPIR